MNVCIIWMKSNTVHTLANVPLWWIWLVMFISHFDTDSKTEWNINTLNAEWIRDGKDIAIYIKHTHKKRIRFLLLHLVGFDFIGFCPLLSVLSRIQSRKLEKVVKNIEYFGFPCWFMVFCYFEMSASNLFWQ